MDSGSGNQVLCTPYEASHASTGRIWFQVFNQRVRTFSAAKEMQPTTEPNQEAARVAINVGIACAHLTEAEMGCDADERRDDIRPADARHTDQSQHIT